MATGDLPEIGRSLKNNHWLMEAFGEQRKWQIGSRKRKNLHYRSTPGQKLGGLRIYFLQMAFHI